MLVRQPPVNQGVQGWVLAVQLVCATGCNSARSSLGTDCCGCNCPCISLRKKHQHMTASLIGWCRVDLMKMRSCSMLWHKAGRCAIIVEPRIGGTLTTLRVAYLANVVPAGLIVADGPARSTPQLIPTNNHSANRLRQKRADTAL